MSLIGKARFLGAIFQAAILRQNRPVHVVYVLTKRCNLRCRYCPIFETGNTQNTQELNTGQVIGILDKLIENGMRFCSFTGGEVLLRPDIGDIVRHVKKHRIECTLGTNGILLPAKFEDVKDIDGISISVDGPREVHDGLRGEGSFEKAIEAVRFATGRGKRVDMTAVLRRENLKHIDYIVDLARSCKATAKLLPMHCGTGSSCSGSAASDSELRGAYARIFELKQTGAPIRFSRRCYEYVTRWADFTRYSMPGAEVPPWRLKCQTGYRRCTIDADGRMCPCFPTIFKFAGKNCLETGIPEAMEHIRLNNPCGACCDPPIVELDLLLSPDWRAVVENIADGIKRR